MGLRQESCGDPGVTHACVHDLISSRPWAVVAEARELRTGSARLFRVQDRNRCTKQRRMVKQPIGI
jgi:hypothetical protein